MPQKRRLHQIKHDYQYDDQCNINIVQVRTLCGAATVSAMSANSNQCDEYAKLARLVLLFNTH